MSCGEETIYIAAGATWDDVTFGYRDATGAVIPLTGFNARGVLKDIGGTVKLTLDSAGGSPNLIVDAAGGNVTPAVASTVTPTLIENGARTELRLFLEIYDASTPPEIHPFGPLVGYPVVVQPDNIP